MEPSNVTSISKENYQNDKFKEPAAKRQKIQHLETALDILRNMTPKYPRETDGPPSPHEISFKTALKEKNYNAVILRLNYIDKKYLTFLLYYSVKDNQLLPRIISNNYIKQNPLIFNNSLEELDLTYQNAIKDLLNKELNRTNPTSIPESIQGKGIEPSTKQKDDFLTTEMKKPIDFHLMLSLENGLGVHLSILANSCEYFNNDSFRKMNEGRSGNIDLQDYNPEIIKAVVDFCYGKEIQLPEELDVLYLFIRELMRASDFFVIPTLKNKIVDIIIEKNCLKDLKEMEDFSEIFQILLSTFLEKGIKDKDLNLFNQALGLAKEKKIDWRTDPNCRKCILEALKIPELHDTLIRSRGFYEFDVEKNFRINSGLLNACRRNNNQYYSRDIVDIKKKFLLEFLAFLHGDFLPENEDRIKPYYRLAEGLGISFLVFPEFYSPKKGNNLDMLLRLDVVYHLTISTWMDLTELALDCDTVMRQIIQFEHEVKISKEVENRLDYKRKILEQIKDSKNIEWFKKLLRSPHLDSILTSPGAMQLFQETLKDPIFKEAIVKNKNDLTDTEKDMHMRRFVATNRYPKLGATLEQFNYPSSHSYPIILETLIKYSCGEKSLPKPLEPNFLNDLFKTSEEFEIPFLKEDYIELIKNQSQIFAHLDIIPTFLKSFHEPKVATAVCVHILNILNESYFFDSNPQLLERNELWAALEKVLKEYGGIVDTYLPTNGRKISDNFIEALCNLCPNLKTLNLGECDDISLSAIETLQKKLSSLENLTLGKVKGCDNPDKRKQLIELLTQFRKLQTLNLGFFYAFEDKEMTIFDKLNVSDLRIRIRSLEKRKPIEILAKLKNLTKLFIYLGKGKTIPPKKLKDKGIDITLMIGKPKIKNGIEIA